MKLQLAACLLLLSAGTQLEARKMVDFPLNRSPSFKAYKKIEAEAPSLFTVEEHFVLGKKAMESKNYVDAEQHLTAVINDDPGGPHYGQALFLIAESYFQLEEFDAASDSLTKYLASEHHPELFTEAIEMKYQIAEKFRLGARRHFFGTKKLPKWASGTEVAAGIYDEVVAAFPTSELAAKSLYSKGTLLSDNGEWKRAQESFLFLTRKFPGHPLALEAFLSISRIYRQESQQEKQNPDLIALAELHLKRFKEEYPSHPFQEKIEEDILAIKEFYAEGLFETGQFYEKIAKTRASTLYYQMAIKNFPETKTAQRAQERMDHLQKIAHFSP